MGELDVALESFREVVVAITLLPEGGGNTRHTRAHGGGGLGSVARPDRVGRL
jgi:hypothetical protein